MQYEILNKTATGVMGDVYKALDTETGRLVTLKTINVTALPRTYTVPDAFQVIGRTCSWPIDGLRFESARDYHYFQYFSWALAGVPVKTSPSPVS